MYLNVTKLLFLLALVKVSQTTNEEKSVGSEVEDGKSSLVFVFDTTGSMYNDLKQLREGAEMILNTALEESGIIGDFVFVPFHDPAVGPATVTRDKEVFKQALELVSVYGGGDCPEKSLGGIQLALNVSEPRSFIYVFTDATAGDHRLVGRVLDSVQRKQSQVVFVLTGHCNDLDKPTYKVYQQIAAASSGQVFNLNKTSVHKVLDFVKSSIKGRTVNLGSSVNPAGYNFTQGIPVDSSLGEVTVSVSGAKPQITVVDPDGVQLTGPPKLVTTLDLSEIMVVKVMQPEPGNWTITVGSEEDYSVKVVGLSNLTFSHGFSVEPPGSMAETSYRPLKGTYNHMMVSLSQPDLPVKIEYAEILTLGGKTLFELPLKEVKGKVYLADAFIPPDEFFYIAINGKDENGQELRRVGGTAVQAKLPDVPYLLAQKKIEAHSHTRVVLKCKVESLVPVTAVWTKESDRIQGKISSLQTTTIEYVIEDMTEADVGRYRCNAKNVAGISRTATDVILLVDPPQVSVQSTSLNLQMGDNANITCTVFSEALLLKFEFLSLNDESHSGVDIAVQPNIDGIYTYNKTVEDATLADAGNYTCLAANRGGSSNKTVTVLVQSAPTAQILGPHELEAKLHEVVTIYCFVQNSGVIQWSNNGTITKEVEVKSSHTDFLAVNVTNDGDWTCKGVRGNLEASDSVQISLLQKPVVTILGSKNVTVLNGSTVEITCDVEAKPAPRVLWYRGSEETLYNHTLTALDSKTFRSTLQLNSLTEDVNGTYLCVGENSAGIHQDRATVLVRRKMTLLQGFNDTSVQLYQHIELNCDVSGYPPPVFTWHHNGTELASKLNVHFSEDNRKAYIARVDFTDLGPYSCVADNGYERIEVNGSLSVYGLDAPVLSKGQLTKRVVKQGDSTLFTCSILTGNPEPTLKWEYKSSKSSNFTALHNTTKEDGLKLTIKNVTVSNAGTYRCVAENVMGQDELHIELVVHYPPQFKSAKQADIAQKPLEVETGGTVSFSCDALGLPPPIVLWNKNGRPMAYDGNSHSTNETLVIDEVTEYDAGLYSCKAKSPMGSVEKNFTLIVYALPKIVPPTTATEQEMFEGQLVELPCEARGVPSPEVVWRHNGELVAGTDNRKFIDEFGIRFIANVTDFGDYTCIAKNRYGNTSFSYSLFIWVPPYIEPPLEGGKNVIAGQSTSLQCDVVGFPVPNVQWEFGEETLKENTTELSFNDVGNLYITNASYKHEGVYVCVAENIAGVARKFTYLTVNEPPKILVDNYTGPYLATNMDLAVTVACSVAGKPKPYVVWSRDDVYLEKDARYEIESDGALTIKSPTEDMSGNYTCIARNTFGTMNKTVEVIVYTLPTRMQSEAPYPIFTVMENTNISIECPTRASHKDTVKWYKDATLISSGNLQIANVSRESQTTYACVVSNAVGSAYSAITLNIEWSPRFVDNSEVDDESEHSDGTIGNSNIGIENSDTRTGILDSKINYSDTRTESSDRRLNFLHIAVQNTNITTESSQKKEIENAKHDTNSTKKKEIVSDIVSIKNKTLNTTVGAQNNRDAKTTTTNNQIASNANNGVANTNSKNVHRNSKHYDKGIQIVEVVAGDDIYLDCSVDAKPIAKTHWLFNSKPLAFVDRSRLPLLNVRARNSGRYKCVAGNKHGTVVKEFRVDVLKPPFISEFDVVDVLLMEGVNATLDCVAEGAPEPTVQWTFNNTRWHVDNTSLVATNVAITDEGVFRCDARNAAGHTHIAYRVGVVVGAKIEDIVVYREGEGASVTGPVDAELNSHIRIACKAAGKPTPSIQWLRNGKVLSENQQDISYADLTIDGVLTSQAGIYSCVVSNEGGNDDRTIRIEVLEPPKIFRSLFKLEKSSGNTVSLEVLSGQAYYLHCHAYGNPVPELYWFREGLPLMLFDDTMVSTEYGEVIEVKQALQAQSGNYTCVARNKLGNTSVVYLVDVLVPPPQPKDSSRAVTSRVGGPLTLTCPVEGTPTPHVMWNKHPYMEIGEQTPRLSLTQDNVTMIINSTQVSDSGNYSCIMTNKVGTTEVTFDVTVEKPPSIAGHTTPGFIETHDVALRKSIVLKCETDGHPLPKITWLKDTQQLSDSISNVNRVLGNSILAIWSVTSRDAGQYICVAENVAGSANTRYNVRVQVPGKWSEWGQWSYCNMTCGLGHQQRARACQYIDDNNNVIDKSNVSDKFILDESACKGPSNETRKCHMPPCEDTSVPSWSAWSRWFPCSATCGTGTQARTRRCRGKPCIGDNVQIRKCPDLPRCENERDKSDHNVVDPVEQTEKNVYAPEAVFEMEPEIVQSHYSPDVEEFYLATGSKQSTVFYDVAVNSNLDGSDVAPCGAGFRLNTSDGVCEDIDECVVASNQCHSTQVCVNVAGAYRCTCQPGLLSLGPGQRCMDINECSQDISGCEYACVNVVGGYVCACPHNMRLHADKHHCYPVQSAASLYRKPYSYEEQDTGEYLSTSVEYPARYKHIKN